MRISFDLDDTLICYQPDVPREPRLPWYLRLIGGNEPLRQGTVALTRRLQESGWELWVYTTSRRSPNLVRSWLRCHGVRVAGVINQDVHDARLKRRPNEYPPSKNPKAFDIDLHVDDSEGVRIEGDTYGFNVVVVAPSDVGWVEKVMLAAQAMEQAGKNQVI